MDKTEFVYVTYIATTPEKLWNALLDPKMTEQYWQNENISDWKAGSKWEHRGFDRDRSLRLVGEVLESDPPRRLVVTWAFPADAARKDRHTRVTFEIEPVRDVVRLTVIHQELEAGSQMDKGIREGWPKVLSSLKSLLETGRALPKLW